MRHAKVPILSQARNRGFSAAGLLLYLQRAFSAGDKKKDRQRQSF